MDSSGEARRDALFMAAVNPVDGSMTQVQISYERMQAVGRRSIVHAKECGLLVPEILQKPFAIFEGIRRDEDDDKWGCGWRCYCGIPSRSFRQDGSDAPPYKNQVYVVFVNDDGVAYNWRWEKSDESDSRLPIEHESRFTRRLL